MNFKQNFRLVNIERSGRLIKLQCRGEDLKRYIFTIKNYYPYMYIDSFTNIPLRFKNRIVSRKSNEYTHLILSTQVDKVQVKNPEDIYDIKDATSDNVTAEADVIYTTRALTDLKIRSGYFKLKNYKNISKTDLKINIEDIIPIDDINNISVREMHFDIESVNGKTVLIGFYDSYTNTYVSIIWTKEKTGVEYSSYNSFKRTKTGKVKHKDAIPHIIYKVKSLKDLMSTFVLLVKKYEPDVLSGWYSSGYDVPEIFKDCINTGVNIRDISPFRSAPAPEKIKGIVQTDLLTGYETYKSSALKYTKLALVMKDEFGVYVPAHPETIPEMWKNDWRALVQYNISHVDSCRFISNELGLIDFAYELAYTCCCRFDDTFSSMRLIDALILSCKDEKIVYPNKPDYSDNTDNIVQGATVIEPVPNKYGDNGRYIIELDAAKLYPSIMWSGNFGIETLDVNGDITVPLLKLVSPEFVEKNKLKIQRHPEKYLVRHDGVYKITQTVRFSSKKDSEIKKAYNFLFNLRTKYEQKLDDELANNRNPAIIKMLKRKIMAVKIDTNTIYGLTGNAGFRLYKKIVQECVTQVGRDYINFMISTINVYGHKHNIGQKIIYGDTDSIHVEINSKDLETAITNGNKIVNIINKKSSEFASVYGIKNHMFKVKMEAVASAGIYKAKKRYALKHVWKDGYILVEPEYKIVGLEPKRSDNPELTGKTMSKVINILLSYPVNDAKAKAMEVYVAEMNKMLSRQYSYFEIGIPKGIQKPIPEYFHGSCSKCGFTTNKGYVPFYEWDYRKLYCPHCDTTLRYNRPIHVFASAFSNKYLKTNFNVMSKVRYIYVDFPGNDTYPETHVIAIDDETVIPSDLVYAIDWERQIDKVLTEKIMPLLDIIQPVAIVTRKNKKPKNKVGHIQSKL